MRWGWGWRRVKPGLGTWASQTELASEQRGGPEGERNRAKAWQSMELQLKEPGGSQLTVGPAWVVAGVWLGRHLDREASQFAICGGAAAPGCFQSQKVWLGKWGSFAADRETQQRAETHMVLRVEA